MNKATDGPSGPTINVSHSSLADGLKKMASTTPHEQTSQGSKSVGLKDGSKSVLSNITNQAHIRPTRPQDQLMAKNGKGIK